MASTKPNTKPNTIPIKSNPTSELTRIKEAVNAHNSTKHICIGIMIAILVVMIIYVIIMFEMYISGSWIFATYTPPTPPVPYFYPLGKVTPLTAQEIAHRNEVICAGGGPCPPPS